jgi:hypothetical protein
MPSGQNTEYHPHPVRPGKTSLVGIQVFDKEADDIVGELFHVIKRSAQDITHRGQSRTDPVPLVIFHLSLLLFLCVLLQAVSQIDQSFTQAIILILNT